MFYVISFYIALYLYFSDEESGQGNSVDDYGNIPHGPMQIDSAMPLIWFATSQMDTAGWHDKDTAAHTATAFLCHDTYLRK